MEYHIQCDENDIARYVVLTRDAEPAGRIAARLDDHRFISDSRGYNVFTGHLDGTPVSVVSTGVGGPQLAIGAEELAHMGSDTFIRLANGRALQDGLRPGDLIMPTGAYRGGTTADHYLPRPFPALPDFSLLRALDDAARTLGVRPHRGINISVDAPFADRDDRFWSTCRHAHAVSLDMELDTLFVMSNDNRWRSAAILIIDEGADGEQSTDTTFPEAGEEDAIRLVLTAIRSIALGDAEYSPAGQR